MVKIAWYHSKEDLEMQLVGYVVCGYGVTLLIIFAEFGARRNASPVKKRNTNGLGRSKVSFMLECTLHSSTFFLVRSWLAL